MAKTRPMLFTALAAVTRLRLAIGAPALWESSVIPPLNGNGVLTPNQPQTVYAAAGMALLVRTQCLGGPADMMVTFSSLRDDIKPLIVIALDETGSPSDLVPLATSVDNWKEDSRGDHYVIARGVPPNGAISAVINPGILGQGDEIDGWLSVKCAFVMAYDPLFFHHIMSERICPVGTVSPGAVAQKMDVICSGHGTCLPDGKCSCQLGYAGFACEQMTSDLVATTKTTDSISLASDEWKFWRILVPSSYVGGFLRVESIATSPLVILVSEGTVPTKSDFDESNFGDWLNQSKRSKLSYRLMSEKDITASMPPSTTHGRDRDGKCVADLGLSDSQEQNCKTSAYSSCKDVCVSCMLCTSSGDVGACNKDCEVCKSFKCNVELATCAGSVACAGSMATRCASECGSCVHCSGSLDPACATCECCAACVPVLLRCMQEKNAPSTSRYIYVGIYNHPGYYNTEPVIHSYVSIDITRSGYSDKSDMPNSWVEDLYDPFHDLTELATTGQTLYPDGKQFMYNVNLVSGRAGVVVNVFEGRLTLIQCTESEVTRWSLGFSGSGKVEHVLVSTVKAPKSLFDFNQVEESVGQRVDLLVESSSVWVGLFASSDGSVLVSFASVSADGFIATGSSAGTEPSIPVGFVVAFVIMLLMWVVLSNKAMDLQALLSRISGFLFGNRRPRGMAPLTRTSDGRRHSEPYHSHSEGEDEAVDEHFLHRGGRDVDDGM
eukprot:TRINITY_DN39806_c0_g1_i1.p1 TRINITY_DN39806_c0_g1~~TRINITY_DN39806_c0_g1_i1.p1  ORF type:complete len:721 (-),score=89.02 TRINITY_DN39806_c0_g1_i1:219-2381(-)